MAPDRRRTAGLPAPAQAASSRAGQVTGQVAGQVAPRWPWRARGAHEGVLTLRPHQALIPLGGYVVRMREVSGKAWSRGAALRALLVCAVILGLCAMHVFAALGQHHDPLRGALAPGAPAVGAPTVDGPAMGDPSAEEPAAQESVMVLLMHHGSTSGSVASTAASTADAPAASTTSAVSAAMKHDHHPMLDCVLFLSAGIALLVVLVAYAAARALRASYWVFSCWPRAATASTPQRGPPPWRWPRVSLCVIRV
jgi:hypothetical protein